MSAILQSSPVITRFAPSPTGSLHLGNARTAFFCYLWARKSGGRFILRIEDTDAERSRLRFRDELMAELRWLGLDWDEGPDIGGPSAPYSQAERGEFYRTLFAQLEMNDQAYPCYCTAEELELSRKLQRMSGKPPRYAGTCRHLTSAERAEREARGLRAALRFAVPEDRIIEFTDTPRQLLLLDALGMRRPGYGHVGLLVGADGAPLSKRHGSTSAQEFRERGFLPAAILNHLFRLGHTSDIEGWSPVSGMPAHFRPQHLGRAPARFDETQLVHWQKEAVGRMSAAQIRVWLGSGDSAEFVDWVRHNLVLPADAAPWRTVVCGDLPPLGKGEQHVIAAAGPEFFTAAAEAFGQS